MQHIEVTLPGEISAGIGEVGMRRGSGCKNGTCSFPFIIEDTVVATRLSSYSQGTTGFNWFADIYVSEDDGVSYQLVETFDLPIGEAYVADFVGLVLSKCSLLKVKYRYGTGVVTNPQLNLTLERLN